MALLEKINALKAITELPTLIQWPASLRTEHPTFLSNERIFKEPEVCTTIFTWKKLDPPIDIFQVVASPENDNKVLKFHYNASGGFQGKGYKEFEKEIQRSCRKNDFCQYIKNGSHRAGTVLKKKFKCSFNNMYKKTNKENESPNKKSRNGRTKLPQNKQMKCGVSFSISLHPEEGFFYIWCRKGTIPFHRCHEKETPIDMWAKPFDFSKDNVTNYNKMRAAGLPPAYIRLVAQLNSSLPVTTSLIEHITSGSKLVFTMKCKVRNVIEVNILINTLNLCLVLNIYFKDVDWKENSPTLAQVLQYLTDKCCKWTALYESRSPNIENSIVLAKSIFAKDAKMIADDSTDIKGLFPSFRLPTLEENDFFVTAEESRTQQQLKDEQNLMVAYVWSNSEDLKRFKAFPEIIQIDGLEKTNNENMVLITLAGMDANRKMFPIARAYVPNQKRWVFRYIFEYAFPRLVGREVLTMVQVIVTDGDSNETQQLDESLEKYYCNAKRIRCGWHLVDRNLWKEKLVRIPFKCDEEEANKIRTVSPNIYVSFIMSNHDIIEGMFLNFQDNKELDLFLHAKHS